MVTKATNLTRKPGGHLATTKYLLPIPELIMQDQLRL